MRVRYTHKSARGRTLLWYDEKVAVGIRHAAVVHRRGGRVHVYRIPIFHAAVASTADGAQTPDKIRSTFWEREGPPSQLVGRHLALCCVGCEIRIGVLYGLKGIVHHRRPDPVQP